MQKQKTKKKQKMKCGENVQKSNEDSIAECF